MKELKLDILEFSNYVINYCNKENDDSDKITKLKLHKVVYYVYSILLSKLKVKLFDDKVYAYQYGPVFKELLRHYRDFHYEELPIELASVEKIQKQMRTELNKREYNVLHEVLSYFNQFSASHLVDLTHSEDPWKYTPQSKAIPESMIIKWFDEKILLDG